MATNIDGLTTIAEVNPADIIECQSSGINYQHSFSNQWLLHRGRNTISIYKSATATCAIRPGVIHLNNGTSDYLRESSAFSSLTISGATGWSFITCSDLMVYTQRAATGAVTVRPTSTCYTYVDGANTGYNHVKAGYYYSEDERIIGAVYWDGSAIQYVINNLNGSDEIGENSLGSWERIGKNQICKVSAGPTSKAVTSTSGSVYYGPLFDMGVWPIATTSSFSTLKSAHVTATGNDIWLTSVVSQAPDITGAGDWYPYRAASNTVNVQVWVTGIGYWHV